jgi:catechol 2,3-dioxygenase-like lactoylglutathione lyase family enzyme
MISSIIGIAFDCPNANELADFYVELSGWEKEISTDEWAALRTPEGILLVFQTVENYIPPIWPWKDGEQQQMAHIDFKVDNLSETVEYALTCGAKKSDVQFYDTSVVMFDPAGHPFCLSTVSQ